MLKMLEWPFKGTAHTKNENCHLLVFMLFQIYMTHFRYHKNHNHERRLVIQFRNNMSKGRQIFHSRLNSSF